MDINQTIRRSYEESKRIIQEAQKNNQLVLFIGAGASIDSGMPSWRNALDKIKKRLGYEEKEERSIPDNPLKIPQYYFNQRGKNEYKRLMSEIFKYGETLPTTSLHQRLMKFNTSTIITTNYDHLIEQAAEENGEAMQVISSDTDLAYKNLGKELIKMHGDFEHDNFVLKDDDYLNYSSNFKLIENYIKSIIGTKVVLFIGYSFNDPDIKQVFKWSREILKDDIRRSYLINIDNEYDRELEDDYQNFGINVIFAKSWIKNKGKEDVSPSTLINQTLDKILDEKGSALDLVYENLKGFEDFNYISGKYINLAFSQVGIILNENNLLEAKNYESKGKAQNIFNILTTEETEETKKIKETLRKSRVEGYTNSKGEEESFYKKEERADREEGKTIEWSKAVRNFDFKKLRSIRDENNISLSENNPKKYLLQAAISYYLRDYVICYEYLQQASKYLYKQHNYPFYLIAEINRKWVGQFILDNYLGSSQIRSKIEEEISSINFTRTLNSFPDLGNNNDFLTELTNFKFSYGLLQDVYDKGPKIKNESNNVYFGYTIPNYRLLRNDVDDFFNYELENYLLLDNLVENINVYKMYIRNMLISAEASDKKDTLFAGHLKGQNLHLKNFDEFELYIILSFFGSHEEVDKLFYDTVSLVKISDSGLEYLKTIIKNFSKSDAIDNNTYIENIYWKLIALCGHIQLNTDVVMELLKSFASKISSYNMAFYLDYMINVINNALRQNLIVDEQREALDNLLETVLKKVLSQNSDESYIYIRLVNVITVCLKKLKFTFGNVEKINQFKKKDYYLILTIIYPLCKNLTKAGLKNYFKKRLLNKTKIQNYPDYSEFYSIVVGNEILEPSGELEQVIIDYLKLQDKKADEVTQMPNYIENILSNFSRLYLVNKVVNKKEIKKVINTYGTVEQKWTTELEEFNYDDFKIDWLLHYNKALLEIVSAKTEIRLKIREKFKKEYKKGNITRNLLNIYFDYFAD
ncbi:SIR2 family protein [Lactobacillus sp. PV012]|uniref:SIR2 family protein n=1 Tax=Lactobacillus sp. PV012 TaxID=2594494 RepID=UPI002240BFA3|nr:SIR2 family protein [Lactobacillus sp. PV012]QNQ82757.1 hypothetical protein FP433_06770 [Lactobacillus sp. PV012]